MGHVLLITRNSVERLGAQSVKPPCPCIIQKPDNSLPAADAGARDCFIAIVPDDLPPLTLRELAAKVELIVNRL